MDGWRRVVKEKGSIEEGRASLENWTDLLASGWSLSLMEETFPIPFPDHYLKGKENNNLIRFEVRWKVPSLVSLFRNCERDLLSKRKGVPRIRSLDLNFFKLSSSFSFFSIREISRIKWNDWRKLLYFSLSPIWIIRVYHKILLQIINHDSKKKKEKKIFCRLRLLVHNLSTRLSISEWLRCSIRSKSRPGGIFDEIKQIDASFYGGALCWKIY